VTPLAPEACLRKRLNLTARGISPVDNLTNPFNKAKNGIFQPVFHSDVPARQSYT
jgi:hypothetical protein